MHQPYYRDTATGSSGLPWVRLHAVMNYHPMAAILKEHSGVRVTFNLVPCLVKQLLEYAGDGRKDDFWERTAIPAADLTAEDRIFLLQNFFMANWERAIKPHKRYIELMEKRGFNPVDTELERASTLFSSQDFLDLQVWFNLVWFHPLAMDGDRELAGLMAKKRNFQEEDKEYILAKQMETIGRVVPLYRELEEGGQVELSTSPFYHPILPLLVNMESAREALPGLELPSPPFSHPEDATLQLEKAVNFHREIFGRHPDGLWPSEGSVSEEMISTVLDSGFSWMATDESILFRSMGAVPPGTSVDEETRHSLLYKPYKLERNGRSLGIVFRDHHISDAIGFNYSHWPPAKGAADLIGRLEGIAKKCSRDGSPMISIILDGENPWEYYQDCGRTFLKEFYDGLARSSRLKPVTISQGIDESSGEKNIPRLFAGSWINSDFSIWIGQSEDRRAWKLLIKAREILDRMSREGEEAQERYREALEEILNSEGSDWFWWYGDEHNSGNDEAFDELFRLRLKNVYRLAGLEIPDELRFSILTPGKRTVPPLQFFSFINPIIDGKVTSYFEWLSAGTYLVERLGTTMQPSECLIPAIYLGFNSVSLFIRLDLSSRLTLDNLNDYRFTVHFKKPREFRLELNGDRKGAMEIRCEPGQEDDRGGGECRVAAAMDDIMELSVPFDLLEAEPGDEIRFFISLSLEGQQLGHWPQQGHLILEMPGEDFEEKIWST
jgi:alpha-amylase/alpha-mannosidase (GH57 family)